MRFARASEHFHSSKIESMRSLEHNGSALPFSSLAYRLDMILLEPVLEMGGHHEHLD